MNWKAPFLPPEKIESIADEFLSQYHPSRSLPIPIEDIIDVGMGLNIVPMPGLYFHGVNGFLSRNRTEIWIDKYQWDHLDKKCRFTLAHEISHYVLHADLYELADLENDELAGIGTMEKYINWMYSIPTSEIGWYETHANNFAGYVLVPRTELERECRKAVAKFSAELKEKFKDLTIPVKDAWSFMAGEIAKSFDVNPQVVEIRIRNDDVPEKILLT
ncbi:ImmA/IrrE family metallo-endopeptidase [bacterium]|nr:ImmA/IrrE family metallo-endopeptidase [bacterium]